MSKVEMGDAESLRDKIYFVSINQLHFFLACIFVCLLPNLHLLKKKNGVTQGCG